MVQKSLACAPHAGVAQLVEQRIRNAKVVGSTPISGTNPYKEWLIYWGLRAKSPVQNAVWIGEWIGVSRAHVPSRGARAFFRTQHAIYWHNPRQYSEHPNLLVRRK